MVVFDEEKQNRRLGDLRKEEEEQLAQALSQKYGITYIDLTTVPINTEGLRIISEEESRAASLAVYNIVGKKASIAVLAPENEKTVAAIEKLKEKGYIPTLYMVSKEGLAKAWSRYKDLSFSFETKGGALDIGNDEIASFLDTVHNLEDVKKLINNILQLKKSARISKILEIIVAGALATDASDIHLEPEQEYTRLRYRLDGVLTDILNFDKETYKLVLSRIKLLSGLKLNVKDTPQDGRFSIKVRESDIEIRTSVLPGAYSETVVLRILNPKAIQVPMEELGIPDKLFKIIDHEIAKPNGMILTTGPTGSGKTTTLYSFLRKVFSSEIKIITIENPIEYHLNGIVQTQTDSAKGYTFSEGLRSALRQDPDIIMVGEIRDAETAEIAINAALTGHLVFSTLHTNNAAGAFPRLIDLGVNPKVLTSAINISMAQRLVRKLCSNCKKESTLSLEQKILVEKILKNVVDRSTIPEKMTLWEAVGCEKCNLTGYKGRIGIYEAIRTDSIIEKIVQNNPSEREIKKAAEPQGILDMRQDGVIKVLQGITTLLELQRVIDLEAEF